MKEFYITLISNSSLDLYPENKPNSFKIQLPRKVSIPENTVVALAEIQYQYNFFNVNVENNSFSFCYGEDIGYGVIEPGFYKSVTEIVQAVLEQTKDCFGEWLKYDNLANKVKIIKNGNSEKSEIIDNLSQSNLTFVFHGVLALQLGFVPGENVFKNNHSTNVGSFHFGIPDQMFVYCDIIEPQIVGYESTQIIKIVNTTHSEVNFGTPCHRDFHRLHYVPVMKNEFDTIEVNIRDITGKLFPFRHGIVTVKLHFICRE